MTKPAITSKASSAAEFLVLIFILLRNISGGVLTQKNREKQKSSLGPKY